MSILTPGAAMQMVQQMIRPLENTVELMLIGANLPKSVYHYTSEAGIRGILESNEFWLTHSDYTNDSREFIDGFDLALNELEIGSAFKGPNIQKSLLPILKEGLFNDHCPNTFICCFSSLPDDLSQWRAYGGDGSGYYLKIDPRHFVQNVVALGKNGFGARTLCQNVIYDKDQKIEKIRMLYKMYVPVMSKLYHANKFRDPLRTAFVRSFCGALYRLVGTFKDPYFKSENEVRVSLTLITTQKQKDDGNFGNRKAMYRKVGEKNIPYFRAALFSDKYLSQNFNLTTPETELNLNKQTLPITEIVAGPSEYRTQAVERMREYCRSIEREIPISHSDGPYRP